MSGAPRAARVKGPTPIIFPRSSSPGEKPSEGAGRIVNAYYEANDGQDTWRRAPGLVPFVDTLKASPRGALEVNGTLYEARVDSAITVSTSGVVTNLTGLLSGTAPVCWARNNKAPTPDLVCVGEAGAYSVTSTTVSPFADPDLPSSVNSVSFLDAYFLFTVADGRIFASDVNGVTVNALSFAKCEAKPDGLLRGVVSGGQFFGFGSDSFEVWANVATSPFPLGRVQVVPVGLAGQWAIAGFEDGWDLPLIFVASDGTVRRLNGYQPDPISPPDVDRAIAAITDRSQLRASVFLADGHAFWVLSSPQWTWIYDAVTGEWHERESFNQVRWRLGYTYKFNGFWYGADLLSNKQMLISPASYVEDTTALSLILEGKVSAFPSRLGMKSAEFDFTTGQGDPLGGTNATDPQVMVQWSRNGGATWSGTALTRSLGAEGEVSKLVRVNRLGLSTHHGHRFRLTVSDPVYCTFRGGKCEPELRERYV